MKHRETIIILAAVVTILAGVLTFLGVRQYTDLFGGSKISAVKIGKEDLNSEAAIFLPNERLHAAMEITSFSDGDQLKGRILFERVDGQPVGGIVPASERSYEIDKRGIIFFWYSTADWPTGVYKFEVTLIDRANQQRDRKIAYFRVATTMTSRVELMSLTIKQPKKGRERRVRVSQHD